MTVYTPPPDRARTLRAALRAHAGAWIQRFYRLEILVGRTVRGMQNEAEAMFRRDVLVPVVQRVAGGLATFDRRGPDVLIETSPELRAIMADVEAIVRRGVQAVEQRNATNLRDLVQHEAEWVRGSAEKVLKVEAPVADLGRIQRAVTDRPYLGGKVEEWFASLIGGDNGATDNVRFAIREGMARGWSEAEIVRALRGRRGTGYSDGRLSGANVSQVRRLVQASAAHASATTRRESFKSLGVDKVRWIATLDTKTCIRCAQREARSPYGMDDAPSPPEHPHCRCTLIPWFGEPEGTRASTDGPVPADVTVESWLEGRSVAEQNEVLGRTRADAWRNGSLTIDKMLGADMEPLTIAELRRMDLIPSEG